MSTFRKEYRELSPELARDIDEIKTRAEALEQSIKRALPIGRERSIAMTRLEEAVMWAVKGVTE